MSKLQGNDKDNRKIAILNKPNHYPNPSACLNPLLILVSTAVDSN